MDEDVVVLLAPALLAALVVTQVFADGDQLAAGPQTVGVAPAGGVMWRTRSVVLCVVTGRGGHRGAARDLRAAAARPSNRRFADSSPGLAARCDHVTT
jgi:hypothetical protein